jgi:fatty acid/phospholipid biosynthesis enzyme
MSMIKSENKTHTATCALSEALRQDGVAAAVVANGGSATVAAAVRTAEIAHYRRVVASALANGLPTQEFARALLDLGTGGV